MNDKEWDEWLGFFRVVWNSLVVNGSVRVCLGRLVVQDCWSGRGLPNCSWPSSSSYFFSSQRWTSQWITRCHWSTQYTREKAAPPASIPATELGEKAHSGPLQYALASARSASPLFFPPRGTLLGKDGMVVMVWLERLGLGWPDHRELIGAAAATGLLPPKTTVGYDLYNSFSNFDQFQ